MNNYWIKDFVEAKKRFSKMKVFLTSGPSVFIQVIRDIGLDVTFNSQEFSMFKDCYTDGYIVYDNLSVFLHGSFPRIDLKEYDEIEIKLNFRKVRFRDFYIEDLLID